MEDLDYYNEMWLESELKKTYLQLKNKMLGLGLWCLIIFYQYHGGHFFWCKKPEYSEKTTDLSEAIDKFYHILYRVQLAISVFWTHTINSDWHWLHG